jgi:hypothetical protein
MASRDVRRLPSIAGSATLTTDLSTNASVEPRTAADSTHARRRAHPGTLGVERIAPAPHGKASGPFIDYLIAFMVNYFASG